MIICSQRLTIRRVAAEDWKSIKGIWENFNSSYYAQYDTPHLTDDENVRARIARWANFSDSIEHIFFAVCLNSELIGYIAFNIRENSHEVGYCFHSDYHGNGYAKESLLVVFDYLRTLGINKFTAGTAINNKPSVALLKSLGFKLTGTDNISFYKDENGNDIIFQGGNFLLDLSK